MKRWKIVNYFHQKKCWLTDNLIYDDVLKAFLYSSLKTEYTF